MVAFCIIYLWLEDNISPSVRFSYLSILPYDKSDFFVACLLIRYCSFSSLILSPIFMISFYIFCKRFFLKRKGLPEARIATIKNVALQYIFISKVNFWWMIKCYLLKFSFIWNFHNKIVRRILCNIFWKSKKILYKRNKRNV